MRPCERIVCGRGYIPHIIFGRALAGSATHQVASPIASATGRRVRAPHAASRASTSFASYTSWRGASREVDAEHRVRTRWPAAAAEVVTAHLGEHVGFDATSVTLPGATRHFNSFEQAARESGWSRVYGGIHFVHAVEDGFTQGRGIGREVSRLLERARR